MKETLTVPPEQLRRTWTPNQLGFQTTEELPALEGLVGQERAVSALKFGLAMRRPGYHIYVAGPSGAGKTSYSCSLADEHAAERSDPSDWVYVHNFDRPDEPLALALPPGTATAFAHQVEDLLDDARRAAGRVMDSPEYERQRSELVARLRAEIGKVMQELEAAALKVGFALTQTERGLAPVPVADGQPLTEEHFAALSADDRRRLSEGAQLVQAAIADAGRRRFELEKALQEELRNLDLNTIHAAMLPVVEHLRKRYSHSPTVMEWLKQVEDALVVTAVPAVTAHPAMAEAAAAAEASHPVAARRQADRFGIFRANVFVHRRKKKGAPVVVEPNPTYANLFGKIELVSHPDGSIETGAMQITAGALHRANGGYLVLQAADVLRTPYVWEALKRALSNREIRVEVPEHEHRFMPVPTIRPQPIPLDVKVILIGGAGLYHALYAQDEGFRKLFKVKAEFDSAFDATESAVSGYARFVAQVCRREDLRHFTVDAVARVIEQSQRIASDQTKLSARFNEVVETVFEAEAWAAAERSALVQAEHVRKAVTERATRSALPANHLQEMIKRGTILVDVDGRVVGQVNGLTVMSMGDFTFGSPSRITARAYMGQKGILHIEREIAMSGQIHDKGLLTLSAYLGDRFAQDKPLAFSASVAFEQTYVPVDGDSASSTELYALLSALADVPIEQGIAVTGSVNQRGEIQPIGGVNEKIEGFFAVCQTLGLTGRQGVMIPSRNVPNLMLAEDVVEAVRAGKFHVWAVSTIEEGIEVLTGMLAGRREADGRYATGSLFDRVDRRIEALARNLKSWNVD